MNLGINDKVKAGLSIAFGVVALATSGTFIYQLDKSHPHGYTNPHHETVDAVSKQGYATDEQKDTLVKATIEGTEHTRKANRWGIAFLISGLGYSVTRKALRR